MILTLANAFDNGVVNYLLGERSSSFSRVFSAFLVIRLVGVRTTFSQRMAQIFPDFHYMAELKSN